MTMAQDRFRKRADLVILPIDDFTNRPILGSKVLIQIENTPGPIRKSEGYHVFINLSERKVVVKLTSGIYHEKNIEIDLDQQWIQKVRMVPNRAYPIPFDATGIQGKASANTRIRIWCPKQIRPNKLLYDYDNRTKAVEGSICIYSMDQEELEGRTCLIEDKDGGYEFFELNGCIDPNRQEYGLSSPLTRSYSKIGTSIYQVHSVNTNDRGEFYLPISGIYPWDGENKAEFHLDVSDGMKNIRSIELIKGRINTLEC